MTRSSLHNIMIPAAPPRAAAGAQGRMQQQQQHQRHPSWQQESPSSSSAGCYADMETPLVAHGRRKNWNNLHPHSTKNTSGPQPQSSAAPNNNINSKELSTVYSTISLEDEPAAESTSTVHNSLDKNKDSYDDYDEDDDNRSFVSSTASSLASSLRDSLLLPFVDDEGDLRDVASGLTALAVTGALIGLCMPKNPQLERGVVYYPWISSVLGYTYTLLWSSCFYPQVLLNYRRQSTAGLSSDFALLNFMGWTFYAVYLSGMFFSHDIQQLYQQRFTNEAKSSVQSNDVLFAVHAALLSFIYLVQIVYYRIKNRHRQKSLTRNCHSRDDNDDDNDDEFHGKNMNTKPSLRRDPSLFRLHRPTWFLVLAMGVPTVTVPFLISTRIMAYACWLDYFYVLGYFKLCCTLTKYTQQVRHNFRRESTQGWNIWYTVLECSGGSLSMLQIVLDSWAMKDWTGITGNLAKFVLGLATLGFDCIFFAQHYVWYAPPSSEQLQPNDRFDIDNVVMSSHDTDEEQGSIITYNDDDDDDNNSIISSSI